MAMIKRGQSPITSFTKESGEVVNNFKDAAVTEAENQLILQKEDVNSEDESTEQPEANLNSDTSNK